MSVEACVHVADDLLVTDRQWQREHRRYEKLAMRFADALPKRPLTYRRQPTWVWQIEVDTSQPRAIRQAIADMALAVRKQRFRYYVALTVDVPAEHSVRAFGVRLLRYFNLTRG